MVSVIEQSDGRFEADSGPPEAAGPTVLRMVVGSQLRTLREAAGISPDQAGYEIRASRSKISRLEHGRVGFKDRDVGDLLTLYGVTDGQQRARVLQLAQQANNQGWWAKYDDVLPDWFETYVGLEQATSLIRTYELQFIPGLFQTAEYARAVTMLGHRGASAEEIDRRVSLRLKRQQVLVGPAPRVWAVIDESALRRTLQVMPFERGGHSAAGGSFAILRFDEADLPDIVYIEQLTGALYLDARPDVDHYQEVMNSLSIEAETPVESEKLLRKIIRAT
jgi:transcriptional regulator with XRE-family HTH domain